METILDAVKKSMLESRSGPDNDFDAKYFLNRLLRYDLIVTKSLTHPSNYPNNEF